MSRGPGACWEAEDLDRSDDDPTPVRAKPLARRVLVHWSREDDVWHATLGRWSVRVGQAPGDPGWEWSAFSRGVSSSPRPRAIGCKGWPAREAAQRDAEATLARLL